MEEENIAGRDQVGSELIDVDMEESLSPQPPMYFNFRLGRDAQQTTKCIKFALSALNLSFCFLGLWGHAAAVLKWFNSITNVGRLGFRRRNKAVACL